MASEELMNREHVALIERAKELSSAATRGPWRQCCPKGDGCDSMFVWSEADHEKPVVSMNQDRRPSHRADAAFIAAAREMVPALLEIIREGQVQQRRLREQLAESLRIVSLVRTAQDYRFKVFHGEHPSENVGHMSAAILDVLNAPLPHEQG